MTRTYDISLRCRCGAVQGLLRGVSATTSNRIICLCDDCQAYGHFLGSSFLDANGGTEVVQVGHNHVHLEQGRDQVACVRLSPKGMFRWYARCCSTPLANTLGPKSPFAGVVRECLGNATDGTSLDEAIGPVRERVQGRYGKGELPPGTQRVVSVSMALRSLRLLSRWWLSGAANPSTFFRSDSPLNEPRVLSTAERSTL